MELIVMRLKDMQRVHPEQIEGRCSKCNAVVAVYPSGQKIMKQYPGMVSLICNVCRQPGEDAMLAPGALQEPSETNRKQ